jgi:hypothetical protein
MVLQKREKILAAVTVGLVLVVAGKYVFSAWRGPVQKLRTERDQLQREVDRKQEKIARSVKAQARIDEWNRRSLPADPQLAASLYSNWLFGLAKESGLDEAKVDVTGGHRQTGRAYQPLRFTVQAEAKIDELTNFLYKFYAVEHLQQIRSLTIKPIEGKSDLDVRLTIEALSLPDAVTTAVNVKEGAFPTAITLTPELRTELLYAGRDGKLTGPAKLQLVGSKGAVDLSFQGPETLDEVRDAVNAKTETTGVVAAVDGDKLTLRAEPADPDAPPARLADSKLDDYRRAIAERNFFAPYKPPPPTTQGPGSPGPPKFDPCKYAYLTGIVGVNDQPEVWLIGRTTGKKYTLREGDTFEVGDVSAKVIRINHRDAEIEFEGKRWLVPMGDNLREAKPLFEPEASGEGDAQ